MDGWIKLHRQILDWEWKQDRNCFVLFVHLLLCACFKPTKWAGQNLGVGQYACSVRRLANDTGLSVSEVRGALKKLCATGELSTKTTNKFTIITIVNFGFFQNISEENNKQIADQTQTESKEKSNNPQTDNKHNKKDNNINNANNSRILIKDIYYIYNPQFCEMEKLRKEIIDITNPIFFDTFVLPLAKES